MKKLICVVAMVMMFGCATAKLECPAMPKPILVEIYPVPGGVCLDDEGVEKLRMNLENLKNYADKLKSIIEKANE